MKVPVTVETLVAAVLLTRGAEREWICDIIDGDRCEASWYEPVHTTLAALHRAGVVTW